MAMTMFEHAIETVLEHEGHFSNDPTDPGGATNYGISLRFLRKIGDLDGDGLPDGDIDGDGDVDVDDVRHMEIGKAVSIYRKHWWEKYGYEQLGSLPISTKVFDLSVNMGSRQAHKVLQRGLRSVTSLPITDDGIIGPVTRTTVRKAVHAELLPAIRSEAAGFYRLLICKKPAFEKYRKGWLRRAYS